MRDVSYMAYVAVMGEAVQNGFIATWALRHGARAGDRHVLPVNWNDALREKLRAMEERIALLPCFCPRCRK